MLLTVHMSPVEMELLPLLCLCLLTVSGTTFADGNNPEVVKVKKGDDVILPCSTNGSVSSQRIEWKTEDDRTVFLYEGHVWGQQDPQFKGRISHFDDELQHGNASIKIKNTKVSDSGNYTCEISNSKKSHVKLLVGGELKDRRGEDERAVSKPSITILGETMDRVQLQCEVLGTSSGFKLKILLKDGSGNNLTEREIQNTERGESYILSYTVNKSNNYRCVATMEEIGHQVYTETYVPGGMSTGAVIGIVVVGVLIVIGMICLTVCCCKKRSNTGGL